MKLSSMPRAAILCATLLGFSFPVHAITIEKPDRPTRTEIEAGQPTLAPFAHVVFCKRYPEDCAANARPDEVVTLNEATLGTLKDVNTSVNKAIRKKSDAPGPLGDIWNIGPRSGDCDDFAVTKRHQLIALGFPPSALRLAVTRTRQGEGHAVTIVRTNKGDLVLDNRFNRLTTWKQADLSLEKLQSGTDPKRWYSKTPLVAFND